MTITEVPTSFGDRPLEAWAEKNENGNFYMLPKF